MRAPPVLFFIFHSHYWLVLLFRDGREFTKLLIKISPLPDDEDTLILKRMATAVRSVATGTVMVALIQGALTAVGLSIAGFERAILFGVIAAFGALIPGIGTTIVFLPVIIYLIIIGSYGWAVFLVVWAATAVGLIDNLLGPYLISRGNAHPFLILLSVLGGVGCLDRLGLLLVR
ncbi:MAG: AI-2E family transporter [Candidatus Paceibacterota bacterium]